MLFKQKPGTYMELYTLFPDMNMYQMDIAACREQIERELEHLQRLKIIAGENISR